MKNRRLIILLMLQVCLLIIATGCIAVKPKHGYNQKNNQQNEEMLDTMKHSTTQPQKEEKTTNTETSLYKDVVTTSKTQTSKIYVTKVFSSSENTTQTTLDKEVELTSEFKDENAQTSEYAKTETIKEDTSETTTCEVIVTTTTAITTVTTTTTATTTKTTTSEVVTTTTPQTQEESTIQTENTSNKLNDCIIIGNRVIPIAYGPANQEMVDNYEVVQDTELWSDARNKYFFGHNTRAFSCLFKVQIGDTITVINNGIETKYRVFRCERGTLTNDGFNIISSVDGTYLINTDFGCETIRMITCFSMFYPPNYRLVVIGEKIE